jgi:TonB family protein
VRSNWLSAFLISLSIHAGVLACVVWKFSHATLSTGAEGSSPSLVDVSYESNGHDTRTVVSPEKKAAVRTAPAAADATTEITATTAAASKPGNAGTGLIDSGDPYYARVRARIEEHLHYPASFSRRRISGKLVVALTLSPTGSLESLNVAETSGNPELDQWVLDSVRNAAPFDAFQGHDRSLQLPIAFVTR